MKKCRNEKIIHDQVKKLNLCAELKQRSLPRSLEIMVNINGNQELVKTGTRLESLLRESIGRRNINQK